MMVLGRRDILKVVLSQHIRLSDFRDGHTNIYKEFESSVIPHKGDFITDTCFDDPYEYEVVEVVVNYQHDECLVHLSPIVIESNDNQAILKYVNMAELHDWECPTKETII